ncbi:adenylyltransferase/cytidyltransferase family protein [Ruminococcus albus]|uniref:Putative glycerol-3-phosphate cytidylyltransferase n=1 Tax=Ruminococcus albus 8 TaxID=246199 RepID=E9S8J7_RUMAL|nr:adenylyltransferase/cytidyltransferase family protein [Ruminococcus albus]EGC04412.1 putative glycerol-3-phosphate cytidylyltransferase [Ruminococcus albus 8]MCC3351459.1 adenylyltransferase/cytidyltransferase family protein [Ruminococcus albus 8]
MIKVITYGTYDMLHYGHIRLLERAKALGDYLIVGITSDDYDKTRGKINLQQSLMERVEAVKATGLADEIIIEEYEGQKIDDIRRLDVDIFTVGSDWEGYFDYLNEYCKVVYLPRTQGISSSELRAEKRKLIIGTIGDGNISKKFIHEMKYVNGVEYIDCNGDLDNVDAVYIASHPSQHYNDVKRALEAGKHVICESPIALTFKQCSELFEMARGRNLVLTDAIKTAYSTAYSRLLGVAKSGRIGNIISVDFVCTSLEDGASILGADLSRKQNSICAWGPTAMLPILQLLGDNCKSILITSMLLDEQINYDGFTKLDFVFDKAVASAKIAKAAKAEGELVITGSKGYIYVPAPWWKTDYFEVRFENSTENKRYFYQLDGEGIRYEIVAFARAVESKKNNFFIKESTSCAIAGIIEKFYSGNCTFI